MKKKMMMISLVGTLSSLAAHAALPPTAESFRHIRAVTESKEVYQTLGPTRWVKSIEGLENGEYLVTASDCVVKVKVEAISTYPVMMVPPLKASVLETDCM